MSDRLLAIAAANHGILASGDVERADVDPNALAALVRGSVLLRLRRGTYVVTADWAAAGPERRLGLRARAVLRERGNADEAVTHQSALAVHGLPLHGVALGVVDLTGRVRRVRREGSLRIHPADPGLDVVEVDGCRAITIAAALAQVALREGREPAVVAADRALAQRGVELDEVVGAVRRLARTPRLGMRAERWLRQCDPLSESVGETRTRLLLTDLGHAPRTQVRVADATGTVVARADFVVGSRVIVEFDGLVKYSGQDGREALVGEKRREDALRALGYEIVRLTWADLENPRQVDALVRAALARAERRLSA
ncbi:MAG TPA: type IV toxin-antitoxin system AbiEi family antitoxin domain-containing protein [Ornithinibacter sp.]|nr:type IV toxin-antitoxin system AbiEi family antitoxin domain-containing protein [Ornithinibacter sp.]